MGRGGLTAKGTLLNSLRQERDGLRLCLHMNLKEKKEEGDDAGSTETPAGGNDVCVCVQLSHSQYLK